MTTQAKLRWWLWTCFTFMVMVVAWFFGFYDALYHHDITRFGFGVLVVYVLSTIWMGWSLKREWSSYGFIEHIAKMMTYVGILGTFIGLAYAFQVLNEIPSDGTLPASLKTQFMAAVSTKFYASIVGIVGHIFLQTQIAILEES